MGDLFVSDPKRSEQLKTNFDGLKIAAKAYNSATALEVHQ